MDDKASVGKISVSSDSVSTLNSEDFVLVSRQGDETPSTNNGSNDEKTGLKVRTNNLSLFPVLLYQTNHRELKEGLLYCGKLDRRENLFKNQFCQ